MDIRVNEKLIELLLEAYRPCRNFGVCREAKWDPALGHIPRGFLGATGALEDVELVMVFSEPGRPHSNERYGPVDDPMRLLESAVRHTYHSFANGTDRFHRNVRWFMSRLYPELTFEEQLRHVWLTEGRLCSIDVEIGSTKDRTCAAHYLLRQVQLLSNATVVAFGGKAKHYVHGLKGDWLEAYALAPPGAYHKPAVPSWERAIAQIKSMRATT